jgi:hypothetical protein
MTNPFAKFVLFCLYSLLPVLGFTQLYNPPSLEFTTTPGGTITLNVSAWSTPEFTENPNPTIFDVDLGILDGSSYPISVSVKDDAEEGVSSFNVFYEGGEKRRTKSLYINVIVNIVDSHVEVIHDYQSVDLDDQSVLVDVLNNDINSGDELFIESIDLVQHGVAQIINNEIEFTAEDGFAGMAFVHYTAVNEDGITDSGTATICVLDEANLSSDGNIYISTSQFKPVTILLPARNMALGNGSSPKGSVEFIGDDVIEYTPFGSFTGIEEFVVRKSDGSIERTIHVEVLENTDQKGPIRDDKVFTSLNIPVLFDIFENDLEEVEITRMPKAISIMADGRFRYIPEEGFVGTKTFTYLAEREGEYYTGNIEIVVDNFYPEKISQFDFVTRSETPLVMNYTVPIQGYFFSILDRPANGELLSFPHYYNYKLGDEACGWTEEGVQIMVYQPNDGFTGTDEFLMRYCAPAGECEEIAVQVEVIENASDCNCVGTDCVWPGDFNADGKVSMEDILPLGYHFGSQGAERNQEGLLWIGDKADDWGAIQNNGKDQKFLDGNGDGKINLEDLELMADNYNKYNNLVASQTLVNKEFPIELVLSQETAEVGDLVYLDIIVGSQEFPALDVHGLTYTLPLSPDVVDTETITVERTPLNWLSNNSPMLDLSRQTSAGRLDIGSTRTTGRSVSGYGSVHRVGFIVIDEIDGVRESNQNKTVDIVLEGLTITDGNGNQYTSDGASVSFELIREKSEEEIGSNEPNIIAYPNPATTELNIHANGNDILEQIDIFNSAGQKMSSTKVKNENQTQISLNQFSEGLYFAKVVSFKGASTIKFKVIK